MKRILALATPTLLISALFGIPAHATTPSTTIIEYATPSPSSSPQGVDVAADGSVWYSETTAGKIAVFHPDHSSTEFPLPPGGQPFILKVATDGSIWFTDSGTHAIGHLDPAKASIVEYPIPSGASPYFIQFAADGSKWFTETAGVGRLSPRGTISEWSVTLEHADDNMEQLSLDRAGNVWFAERNFDGIGAAGTNKVRRLNPATNVISTYLVPTLGGTPSGVVANADGTVWVSEYYANALALLAPNKAPHSDQLVAPQGKNSDGQNAPSSRAATGPVAGANNVVPPSSHTVKPAVTPGWIEYPIPTANADAEDMRVDRRGHLWFEEDAGLLGELSPLEARFTEYTIPSVNSGYYNIALDQKANVLWFTEAGVFAPVVTKIGSLDMRD